MVRRIQFQGRAFLPGRKVVKDNVLGEDDTRSGSLHDHLHRIEIISLHFEIWYPAVPPGRFYIYMKMPPLPLFLPHEGGGKGGGD